MTLKAEDCLVCPPLTAGQLDQILAEAVAAEREACAKIAEEHWEPDPDQFPKQIAAAIRVRSGGPER